jgi:hypothetical protein
MLQAEDIMLTLEEYLLVVLLTSIELNICRINATIL